MMKTIANYCSKIIFVILVSTQNSFADTDYVQAKNLLDTGSILTLTKVVKKIIVKHPGYIVEAELKTKNNIFIFEIDILDSKGQVWELKVDAKTAEVLEKKLDD